jgi:hypothetical protein
MDLSLLARRSDNPIEPSTTVMSFLLSMTVLIQWIPSDPARLLVRSWLDAAKFLTGFSAVGSVGIPAILRHAGIITSGALMFELASAAVLAATILLYQHLSTAQDW